MKWHQEWSQETNSRRLDLGDWFGGASELLASGKWHDDRVALPGSGHLCSDAGSPAAGASGLGPGCHVAHAAVMLSARTSAGLVPRAPGCLRGEMTNSGPHTRPRSRAALPAPLQVAAGRGGGLADAAGNQTTPNGAVAG